MQPAVCVEARSRDGSFFGRGLDGAVRLVGVAAVIEAASGCQFVKFGEIGSKRLFVEIPEAELPDSRCIDDRGAVAEVVEHCLTGGVLACGTFRNRSSADVLSCFGGWRRFDETAEDGRFPDAAMPDENRGSSV